MLPLSNAARLSSYSVRIIAPRKLVFQLMSSFGMGGDMGASGESSRVVHRDGDRLVAEFRSPAGWLTVSTLEEVVLEPPDRIRFRHLRGPLQSAREEFVLKSVGGEKELTHHGGFTCSGSR